MGVSRAQILRYRVRANGLDRRRPDEPNAFRAAAQAGIQDSMPRAAVLSLHARIADVSSGALDDPRLEQVWGPRFSAYVVAAGDRAPFTLGRLPRRGNARGRAFDTADRLRRFLDGRTMSYADAGKQMGVDPNSLRYATTTGTVIIRWEGSGRPTIRCVDAPDVDEEAARLELARRFLHVFGPATVDDFCQWAGVRRPEATTTFAGLAQEVITITTPIGTALALASDEAALLADSPGLPGVRLLPSGDAHYLLWGDQRRLLVTDDARRCELWTSRVWPGAVLIDGEIVGTWSRRGTKVAIDPWRDLTPDEQTAVEAEAASLPLP